MKIGIIGSKGFIGNNLNFYFNKKNNYKIFNFSSFNKYKNKWIKKICNEIKINKPDIIINCAANQNLYDDKKAVKELFNSNLYSNIMFLNQSVKNKNFKGYISFGTKWEFDSNLNYNPLNFYAATKNANDIFFKYYSLKKKITTVSLKIFDTYGTNDKRNKILNLLLRKYKKNQTLKITPGKQYLDYVHIDDVCELINLICEDIRKEKLKGFKMFTVSSKNPIMLKFLIHILNLNLNKKLKVKIGEKKYRSNEAMKPIKKIINYPGWKPKINLVKEIKKIFDGTHD